VKWQKSTHLPGLALRAPLRFRRPNLQQFAPDAAVNAALASGISELEFQLSSGSVANSRRELIAD
jgi:hypothetical protein